MYTAIDMSIWKTVKDWMCKEENSAILDFKTKFKFTSLSVSGYEEVQWKERKFTMGSVSGYEEVQWKERKFTMDSVSELYLKSN